MVGKVEQSVFGRFADLIDPFRRHSVTQQVFVRSVGDSIGAILDEYKIIINKSTVPVGTAEELTRIIQGRLEDRKSTRLNSSH